MSPIQSGGPIFERGESEMQPQSEEHLVERLVTYALERDGEFVVIEHVPARVNVETGERLFSPDTVRRLQQIFRERSTPIRTIQAPVFEFAA
jgi:hypothetical protein